MPVQVSYPGVYIEEVPSGVRTIVGVSTSVTAFVGYLKRGPMDEAVQVFNFGDFERVFGGLDADSEISYGIQQFFLNGGTEAWVVRTAADNPETAQIVLQNENGAGVLGAMAASPGAWGNRLRLDVDYDTTDPANLFNLTVTEFTQQDGELRPGASETFRNLSMDPASSAYARSVVNDGSALLQLEIPEGVTHDEDTAPPAQTGTRSGIDLSEVNLADLSTSAQVNVSLSGDTVGNFTLGADLDTSALTPSRLRRTLQIRLREISEELEQATVEVIGDRLRIRTGRTDNPNAIVTFADEGSGNLAASLGLLAGEGAIENVQQYSLGVGTDTGMQTGAVEGTDGSPPGTSELSGVREDKTGLFALEDVDLFNILCIPRMAALEDTEASTLIGRATDYCAERRAFLIVDIPEGTDDLQEMREWMEDNATLRHKNTAVYFPRVRIADPLNGFRLKARPVSGTIAGLYARTDSARGVWKAPAGIEAVLRGVQALDYKLTDPENGVLNPLGVNALRSFRNIGNVSWGARTLRGSDQLASEWKYIPVRRTTLFIEESLYRGTQWVVFEPNDESLWAQIRLNIGTFMQRLFRQGAFQGTSPREAYFVKCDSETTTQADINRGIVNIKVGFAPLKPAEFVIIKIQQIAGQE